MTLGGPILVQIQGYSPFWIACLPPRWRARILAENVRQAYAGRFPANGVLLELPDGMRWRLRPIDGSPGPDRHDLSMRVAVGWIGFHPQRPLRAFVVACALVLSIVPPFGQAFLRVAEYLDSWRNEIRLMLGLGKTERWEAEWQ